MWRSQFTFLLTTTWSFLALLTAPALAEQRVALVIGNAQYAHAPRLANPLNDAADIGAALTRLGFAVTKLENANFTALRQGLLAFTKAASAAEVALVFYAGHGIEVDQRNFLVPVDARLTSDQDVEFETVPLELVTRSVARASGLRLVILDACRENPFAVSMQRAGATRAIGRGLARVEPAGETLVAYAAKEGTVAADGDGRNSPYAEALLAHLEEPGLELGLMFRHVRDAVLASTGGRQEPFVYGSLSSRGMYLTARLDPEPTPSPAPPSPANESVSERLTAEELAAERVFWESVKDSTDAADFEAYLSHYPQGRFASLARNRLAASQRRDAPPELPESNAESVEAGLELSRADRRLIQLGLAAEGFDPGPADGLFGRITRSAIGRWQASQGEASAGYLDAEDAKLLLASGTKRETEERVPQEAEAETERGHDQGSQSGARREPKCTELSEHGACWEEIVNYPGCFIWDHLDHSSTANWSGTCSEGTAVGEGTLTRETTEDFDWYPKKETGRFVDGKRHGQWISRLANGDVHEGLYVDGKRHGQWVFRDADGDITEGTYIDGKLNGDWVSRDAEGNVRGGSYVNGDKHGHWVEAYGKVVKEGPYENGVKHGRWVERSGNSVDEGTYVNDEKHGHWVERDPKGGVEEGPYVGGKRHGQWVFRDAVGHVYGGSYANDVKDGPWVERDTDGNLALFDDELRGDMVGDVDEAEGSYARGKRNGQWVFRGTKGWLELTEGMGRIVEAQGSLLDGERHGQWTFRDEYGVTTQGNYVNGMRHGRWVIRYDDPEAGKGIREGFYSNNKKDGHWVERSEGFMGLPTKTEAEGSYVNGKREGRWVTRYGDPGEDGWSDIEMCVAGVCN